MVTSSLMSPGRETGPGQIWIGLHVPRVWPPSGSDPGSAAIGSGGPCENTRTLASPKPKTQPFWLQYKNPKKFISFISLPLPLSHPFKFSRPSLTPRQMNTIAVFIPYPDSAVRRRLPPPSDEPETQKPPKISKLEDFYPSYPNLKLILPKTTPPSLDLGI